MMRIVWETARRIANEILLYHYFSDTLLDLLSKLLHIVKTPLVMSSVVMVEPLNIHMLTLVEISLVMSSVVTVEPLNIHMLTLVEISLLMSSVVMVEPVNIHLLTLVEISLVMSSMVMVEPVNIHLLTLVETSLVMSSVVMVEPVNIHLLTLIELSLALMLLLKCIKAINLKIILTLSKKQGISLSSKSALGGIGGGAFKELDFFFGGSKGTSGTLVSRPSPV
ncbi:hypothetical protein pdam_00011947, partial [Pocillopora damicornis]